MAELELKFGLDPQAVERWRERLLQADARREHFVARYFDTPSGRLARNGISLRLRSEGRRWVQTVKVQAQLSVERVEHEVAVQASPGREPTLDLALHAGTAAGRCIEAALGDHATQLSEQYASDVERTYHTFPTGSGGGVEVALDVGEVRANGAREAIVELEMELKQGPPESLFDMAAQALESGGLWLSAETKAQRGQRLLAGAQVRPAKAEPLHVSADVDGPHFLRGVLLNTLAQILPNAAAVATGNTDADVIHQLRVGLRRLRTALRELSFLSGAPLTDWETPLATTFGQLGELRDNEAVAQAVEPLLRAGGATKVAWTSPPVPDSRDTVRSPAFQVTLLHVVQLAQAADAAFAPVTAKQLRAQPSKRLNKLHRRVTDDGRRFDDLPVEVQHRVRKRVKRLRYLTEFAAPLWRARDVGRYVETLKPVQEALGTHNDTAVAAEKFREDAANDPAAWFSAGLLQGHLSTTARAARKALRQVKDRDRFW